LALLCFSRVLANSDLCCAGTIDFCVLIVLIFHRSFFFSFFAKYSSPAAQFATFSVLPQALYCTSQDMPTIPAPSLVLSHEEWPDADFDLPDGAPITTPSDKDDDLDIEMDLCPTTSAKAQTVIARIPTRSALASSFTSSVFTIRPPSTSPADEGDDEGVSTIKALGNDTPKVTSQTPPASRTIEDDFEDGLALPSDLNQLSLPSLSLHHRSSKISLEWGDKDQTSSSQSSDTYSTLGFTNASPSSNSLSSTSLPETESEDDERHNLDGLVIPVSIFESGSGGRHLNKILELKKKASYMTQHVKVAISNSEDDFEAGLILSDDVDLSPSRLLQNAQIQRPHRHSDRSYSAPPQRPPSTSASTLAIAERESQVPNSSTAIVRAPVPKASTFAFPATTATSTKPVEF